MPHVKRKSREHIAVEDIATTFSVDYARQNTMQTQTNLAWFEKLQNEFFEHLKMCKERTPNRPIRVLELGCGSGIFAYKLAESFPDIKVEATDISNGLIEGAKKTYSLKNLTYRVQDATRLNVFNHYDLVIGLFMVHFVVDKVDFMSRVARSLVPHGQIRFIIPIEDKTMLEARRKVLARPPWSEKNANQFCIAGIATEKSPYLEMLTENGSHLVENYICTENIRELKMSASDFQQFLSGIALETKALKMTESEALCYCTEVCSEMPKRNDGTIDFNLRYLEVVATRRMFEPTNNSGLFNSLSHVTKSLCPHRKNLDPEINRVNILSKL